MRYPRLPLPEHKCLLWLFRSCHMLHDSSFAGQQGLCALLLVRGINFAYVICCSLELFYQQHRAMPLVVLRSLHRCYALAFSSP